MRKLPTSSTDNSSSLLEKYRDNKPFRNITNIVLTIIFAVLLAAATYYSQQKSSLLFTIIFVSVPAIILGIAINLIEDYAKGAKFYEERLASEATKNDELSRTIKLLTDQFENLLANTLGVLELYPPYRQLLQKEQRQRKLIGHFIKNAMHPKLSISDISDHDFYELAIEGILHCNKCQVIHHGKISILQKSFGYLNYLQKVDSERIVIVSQNDKEAQEELKDENKVHEFLSVTLPKLSYSIDEDDFFEIAGIRKSQDPDKLPLELNDCFLFDGQMLLFRERKKAIVTLSFKGEQEQICEGVIKVFNELKHQLQIQENYPNYPTKFTRINELNT